MHRVAMLRYPDDFEHRDIRQRRRAIVVPAGRAVSEDAAALLLIRRE